MRGQFLFPKNLGQVCKKQSQYIPKEIIEIENVLKKNNQFI